MPSAACDSCNMSPRIPDASSQICEEDAADPLLVAHDIALLSRAFARCGCSRDETSTLKTSYLSQGCKRPGWMFASGPGSHSAFRTQTQPESASNRLN